MISNYYEKANKHIIVKAVQYNGSNIMECMNFVGGYKIYQILNFKEGIVINAIKVKGKEKRILNGYCIIKKTSGRIDVYNENVFKDTFVKIEEEKKNESL